MIKHRLRRVESFLNHCDHHARTQPSPRRLQTIQDVIDLLQEQVEAIRATPWSGTIEKARALAYLAGIARKTIEAGTLAARLEMLEAVLKQRHTEGRG
jgi:hypothetical protein